MIFRALLPALAAAATLLSAGAVHAQQYRWVDDKGRVQLTDTLPPAGAKNVRRIEASPAQPEGPPLPYEIARVQKDFPVTLYTAPNCKELCEEARALLNKRSVPFTEFQVWNDETAQKLKEVSGGADVPVLAVGRRVLTSFDPGQYDSMLTYAGYPAAGVFAARKQAAPPVPDGYTGPGAPPKPVASKPAAEPAPKSGPYDTSGLVGPAPKTGPYDPSGLQGPPPKTGPYGLPGDSK